MLNGIEGFGSQSAGDFGFVELGLHAFLLLADVVFVFLEVESGATDTSEGIDDFAPGGGVVTQFGLEEIAIETGEDVVEMIDADLQGDVVDFLFGKLVGDNKGVLMTGLEVGLNLLLANPIEVAAGFPVADVVLVDVGHLIRPTVTMLFEFIDDAAVLSVVIHHAVDELTQVFGKTRDFTVTSHGIKGGLRVGQPAGLGLC